MSATPSSYDPQLDTYLAAYHHYAGTAGAQHLCLSLGESLAAVGDDKAQAFFAKHSIAADSEICESYKNAAAVLQQKCERICHIKAITDTGEKAQQFYALLTDKTLQYDPEVAHLLVNALVADTLAHPGEERVLADIKASKNPRLAEVLKCVDRMLYPPAKSEKASSVIRASTVNEGTTKLECYKGLIF